MPDSGKFLLQEGSLLVELGDEGQQPVRIASQPVRVPCPLELAPEQSPSLVPLGEGSLRRCLLSCRSPFGFLCSLLEATGPGPPPIDLSTGRFGRRTARSGLRTSGASDLPEFERIGELLSPTLPVRPLALRLTGPLPRPADPAHVLRRVDSE